MLAHSLGALSIQIQAARSVLTDATSTRPPAQATDAYAAKYGMAAQFRTGTRLGRWP